MASLAAERCPWIGARPRHSHPSQPAKHSMDEAGPPAAGWGGLLAAGTFMLLSIFFWVNTHACSARIREEAVGC